MAGLWENHKRRSSARLAAVQALYEAEISGASADAIITHFMEDKVGEYALIEPEEGANEVKMPLRRPDKLLFTDLVRGALDRQSEFDQMADAQLTAPWTSERLEDVLRCILRAGIYELAARTDSPVKVTITEYVDIARAFYAGAEPGLVNAVLDKVARILRPSEIGGDAVA